MLYGDAGNDGTGLDAGDRAYGGARDEGMFLHGGSNLVAFGEDGGDNFEIPGGVFGTVTGGNGQDRIGMNSFFEAGAQTRIVFTDFTDGQDQVSLSYPVTSTVLRDKTDFINIFDANDDSLISRADGSLGAASNVSYAFSRDGAGESVLTLNFAQATFVLQGADYLV